MNLPKPSSILQQEPLPEERHLESNQKLQRILDTATEVSIIAANAEGLITLFSRGAEKLLGYSAVEMIGIHSPAIFHDASEVEARAEELTKQLGRNVIGFEAFVAMAEIHESERREWTYIRKDRSRRTVELSVTVQRDSDNAISGYLGTAIDVTERKKTEASLGTMTRMLNRTGRMARVGGWVYHVDSESLTWSDSLFELHELDKGLAIGLEESLLFYAPEHRQILERAIKNCLENNRSWDLELPLRTTKGSRLWVRNYGEAVFVDNRIIKMHGSIQDITLHRQAKEELILRAAQMEQLRNTADAACRAKSEFLANMSHEIRNPLTAILGYAELLRDEGDLSAAPEKRLKIIETISNAGQHLLTVINDILDLSKIEADKMTVESVETNLPEILIEVEGLMRTRTTEKGVQLQARLETAIPNRILADPTRIRQILINLVGNAAKFTDHGQIQIVVSVQGDSDRKVIRIDVNDTGAGMTSDQSQPLFNVFSQADTTVTRRHGGTGLGLTICRRLARLMGGDVSLAWTRLGYGSCFRLEIPLVPTKNAKLISDLTTLPNEGNRSNPIIECRLPGRILLVEDGPDNQRLISHILCKAGAKVDIAAHGGIAMEMLAKVDALETPYDLILTDMQMPELDGYSLARKLRAKGCKTPIIALTALAMSEDREKCLAAGCDDYASKPIDKAKLLATCSHWMQNSSGPVCVIRPSNIKSTPYAIDYFGGSLADSPLTS